MIKKKREKKIYHGLFFLVLFIFFVKGIFYIFLIPPWEAPDEPGHFSYIRYLYTYNSIPEKTTDIYDTAINDSFFDQKKKLAQFASKGETEEKRELFDKSAYEPTAPVANLAASPPLYYIYLLPFYMASLSLSSIWTVLILRVGSLLLGLISVILVYKIIQALLPKYKSSPILGMLMMACQPMFTFISSVINSDSMVIMFFLLFIFVSTRMVVNKEYKNMKQILLLGVVTGLSTLVKPQLVMLFPIYIFMVMVQLQTNYRNYVIPVLCAGVIPLLWYLPKVISQGLGYFSYAVVGSNNANIPFWHYPFEFIMNKQPIGIFMSFWGNFGWLDVPMPKLVYILMAIVIVIPLIKLFIEYGYRRVKSTKQQKGFRLLVISSVIYTVVIFLYDFMTFYKTQNFAIQGRYLLPIFPTLVIVMLAGYYMFNTKTRNMLLLLLIGVLLIAQLEMYLSISQHYYNGYYLISPIIRMYN